MISLPLKEHVVHVNHRAQNVCLLLRRDVLVVEMNFVNIRVREKLASHSAQTLGFDFLDGRKVSKRKLVDGLQIQSRRRHRNTKVTVATEFGTASKEARSAGCRKHGGTRPVTPIHHLHDRLETSSSNRLNGFAQQQGCFTRSFGRSGLGRFDINVTRVKGGLLRAAWLARKAAQPRLGAGSREAAVAAFTLHGHDRDTRLVARVGVREIKLGVQGMRGGAAATIPVFRFFKNYLVIARKSEV